MVYVGILEITDKRSPYQTGFFLVKKQEKRSDLSQTTVS